MSAIPIQGGSVSAGNIALFWTAPNYSCSIKLRVINSSANSTGYSCYLNGFTLHYAATIEPSGSNQNWLDTELKVPAGATLHHSTGATNTLEWIVTGIQNDGQP